MMKVKAKEYYGVFKDTIIDTGRTKWLDLLSKYIYEQFWNVYSGSTCVASLKDIDFVTLHDIFDIVSFIHSQAVQILLHNNTILRKHMFIKKKATNERSWVETRHSLFHNWYFFGFRILPKDYTRYSPALNNDINNPTRWVSKLISLRSFFNNYQHFYITTKEIPIASIFSTTFHLHKTTTGIGMQTLIISMKK